MNCVIGFMCGVNILCVVLVVGCVVWCVIYGDVVCVMCDGGDVCGGVW